MQNSRASKLESMKIINSIRKIILIPYLWIISLFVYKASWEFTKGIGWKTLEVHFGKKRYILSK